MDSSELITESEGNMKAFKQMENEDQNEPIKINGDVNGTCGQEDDDEAMEIDNQSIGDITEDGDNSEVMDIVEEKNMQNGEDESDGNELDGECNEIGDDDNNEVGDDENNEIVDAENNTGEEDDEVVIDDDRPDSNADGNEEDDDVHVIEDDVQNGIVHEIDDDDDEDDDDCTEVEVVEPNKITSKDDSESNDIDQSDDDKTYSNNDDIAVKDSTNGTESNSEKNIEIVEEVDLPDDIKGLKRDSLEITLVKHSSKDKNVEEDVNDKDSGDENDNNNKTPDKSKKKKSPTPTPMTPVRRSSRNINKTKSYSDKEACSPKQQEIEKKVILSTPKEEKRKNTIVVSDTKRLAEIASNRNKNGKKEPTLVIIDTNTLMSNKGQVHPNMLSVTSSIRNNNSAISMVPIVSHNNIFSKNSAVKMTPIPAQITATSIPSSLPKPPPTVLPSLTDDMFVVEAPSFIVPYVYEKPPISNLRSYVKQIEKNIKEQEEKRRAEKQRRKLEKKKKREEKKRKLEAEKDEIKKEEDTIKKEVSDVKNQIDSIKSAEDLTKKDKDLTKIVKEDKEDSSNEVDSKIKDEVKEKEEKMEVDEDNEKMNINEVEQKLKVSEDKKEVELEKDDFNKNQDIKKEIEIKGNQSSVKEEIKSDEIKVEKETLQNDKKSDDVNDDHSSKKSVKSDDLSDSDSDLSDSDVEPEVLEDKTNKKSDNYFENPVGKFFMDIGINLVQEHVQTDLLRQQQRKQEKEGKNASKDVQSAINSLKVTLERSKENNAPFKFSLKKCDLCNFRSESDLVLSYHMETPHMKNFNFRCSYCPKEVRSPHDILFHMEAEHCVRGRLERPLAQHQCPNCPFEDNQKGKLSRHILSCAKKYKAERNQEPPLDWEPPAKIPRMRNSGNMKPMGQSLFPTTLANFANVAARGIPGGPIRLPPPQAIPSQAVQNLLSPRGRGRPPITVPGSRFINDGRFNKQPLRPGMVFRPQGSSGSQILIPPNYIPGSQLMQNKSNSTNAAVKLLQQPSISITPLPRQASTAVLSANSAVTATPISGGNHGLKPGRPGGNTSGGKNAFVICEICDGYIKDLEQLRNHMQWIHKVKIHPKMIYNRPPLNCQKCQFRFFTDQGLERHLLGSHGLVTSSMQEAANKGKDAGRCPVCGRVYQWKLLNHVAKDHNMSLKPAHLSYKCTVCTATFSMYKQFENHVYSAHSVVTKKIQDAVKAESSGNKKIITVTASNTGSSNSSNNSSNSGGNSNNSSNSGSSKGEQNY